MAGQAQSAGAVADDLRSFVGPDRRGTGRGRVARKALLRAAGQAFSHKGFRGASIRQIAQAARMNIAAASYHFGGKRELYEAVMRSIALEAPCANVSAWATATSDPAGKVCRVVRGILGCLWDGHAGPCAWRLLARESMDPTPALTMLAKSVAFPALKQLGGYLRSVASSSSGARRAGMAAECIICECLCSRLLLRLGKTASSFEERGADEVARRLTDNAIGCVITR